MKAMFKTQMTKTPFLALGVFVYAALFLSGCGGSGSDSDTPNEEVKAVVTGVVQKGVFNDLKVVAREVNEQTGELAGSEILATVDGGKYRIELPESKHYLLKATGQFIDEVTGKAFSADTPLQGFVKAEQNAEAEKAFNLNLFTDFHSRKTIKKIQSSGDPDQADAAARAEIRELFGLKDDQKIEEADIEGLDQDSKEGDADLELLLFSAALMNSAPNGAAKLAESELFKEMTLKLESEASEQALKDSMNEELGGMSAGYLLGRMQTEQTINIPDELVEDNRLWQCQTGSDCGWVVPTLPTFSMTNSIAYEAAGNVVLQLSLSQALTTPPEISVTTQDGSALAGSDYIADSKVVTFAAGETSKQVNIAILTDNESEATESFTVKLETTDSAVGIFNTDVQVSILDGLPSTSPENVQGLVVNDLCLAGAGTPESLSQAICTTPDATPIAFNQSEDSALKIAYRLGCTSGSNCESLSSSIPVSFALVAEDQSGEETSRVTIGDGLYSEINLSATNSDDQFLRIDAAEVQTFIAAQLANNWSIKLELSSSAQSSLQESLALPNLYPLPNEITFTENYALSFGESGMTFLDDSNNTCGVGSLLVSGQFTPIGEQVISADSDNPSISELCLSWYAEANQPPAMQVSSGALNLAGSVLKLPANHFAFYDLGFDIPGNSNPVLLSGSQILPIPSGQANATTKVLLRSEFLPVAFQVSGAALTTDGVELEYSAIQYLLAMPKFSPTDPRANTANLHTNDGLFSKANGTGTLTLTDSGVEGSISIEEGSTHTAYPKGEFDWHSTTANIHAGRVTGLVSADINYGLEQSAQCPDIECIGNDSTNEYAVKTTPEVLAKMDGHGRWLASVKSDRNTLASWGRTDQAISTFVRPNDFETDKASTLALPGFLVGGGEEYPVTEYLKGHLQGDNQNVNGEFSSHPVGSKQAELGNYHPTGLSVGPETYSDSQGQVVIGDGQDMSSNPLLLRSNLTENTIVTGDAVKYVVRNGGVTGVINVPNDQLSSDIILQGYPMQLSRFAVRFEHNKLDEYNWVDGALALPGLDDTPSGDAGFELYFNNLQIACSGNLGQASLTVELCDGIDNNENGVIDENCNHRLQAWRADSLVSDMRFTAASGTTESCGLVDQLLTLHHETDMKALDQDIGLVAQWTPEGTLFHDDVFFPYDNYLFESTDAADGFPVTLTRGEFDVFDVDSDRYGTLALPAVEVGVPFWNAIVGDVRLANDSSFGESVAEPSVFTAEGKLTDFQPNQNNADLQQAVFDSEDENHQIKAQYQWGNTGFGFTLPVYYSPADFNDDKTPSFIGIEKKADLFVLEASAGINYITPERTELSFGASADIEKLKNLDFRVALGDPDNLAKVDAFLVKFGIAKKAILEPTFTTVHTKADLVNRYADTGITALMYAGLYVGVKRLGEEVAPVTPNQKDPFVTVSEVSAILDSTPDRVLTLMEEDVYDPTLDMLNKAENDIRGDLFALYNQHKDDVLSDNTDNKQQVLDKLTVVDQKYDQVLDKLEEVNTVVDSTIVKTNAIIEQVDGYAQQGEQAVSSIQQIVRQAVEFSNQACSANGLEPGSEALGALSEVVNNLDAIEELLAGLQGLELLLPLATMVADDPEVVNRIEGVNRKIQDRVLRLEAHIATAKQQVVDSACSHNIDDILANTDQFITQLNGQIAVYKDFKANVETKLTELSDLRSSIEESVLVPAREFGVSLDSLITDIKNVPDQTTLETIWTDAEQLFASTDFSQTSGINVFLADSEGETDVFAHVFGSAKSLVETHQETFETAVLDAKAKLPALYYTPDQFRLALVHKIMTTQFVTDLREAINRELAAIYKELNDAVLMAYDQVNFTIKTAVAKVETQANAVKDALEEAYAPVREIPLTSASMDGYAVITTHELERAHVGAEWTIPASSEEDDPASFNAALDVVSWNANNKAEGCSLPSDANGDFNSRLDVSISTHNLPAKIAKADILITELSFGFTLEENPPEALFAMKPIGVNGNLFTEGGIDFEELVLSDVGFTIGLGKIENYLGATASLLVSDVQGEAAFLLGKTCNQDIIQKLDPKVGNFITVPPTGFKGAYARGGVSVPVYTNGCPLTVGVGAEVGIWAIAGPPVTIGGIYGGGAYGKVLCIGALRGQVTAIGQIDQNGEFMFMGEGFGAAGAGLDCDPASWTTVAKSRRDDLCGTGDAVFRAGYKNGWSVDEVSINGIF